MKSCVVIPIYKESLTLNEKISLTAAFNVLGNHEIFLFTHRKMNLDLYFKVLKTKVQVIYFDESYFKSVASYSILMLNSKFYSAFKKFDYILVYQLDAYVFKDELNYWCSKNYDYIGAPWFDIGIRENFFNSFKTSKNPVRRLVKHLVGFHSPCKNLVGNGGFSLRKVNTCRNASRFLKVIEPNLLKYGCNEDVIWSFLVPKYFKNFRTPPFEEALKFSIEQNPRTAFKLLGNEFPFGCHAWDKENHFFWENKISLWNSNGEY